MCMTLGISVMLGEDNKEAKKKMLEIKLDEDFIFGEGTGDDKELAYGDALDDLLSFANELKNMNSQEELKITDLITNVETIVYEEGSRYEVMVYIPFKIVIDTTRQSSSAKEELKTKKEETNNKKEEIVNKKEETDKKDGIPVMEAEPDLPASEGETATETKTNDVPEEKKVQVVKAQEIDNLPEFHGEVEDYLITQENFSEIKSYLSEMKRLGKIKETGALESVSTMPEDASLIVIDELGGLLSILSPVTDGVRFNYKTKKSDSEKNYNSKYIVWYRK